MIIEIDYRKVIPHYQGVMSDVGVTEVPISQLNTERLFSAMKIIKTDLGALMNKIILLLRASCL